ncbi:MAG TPA: hypothetical protein VGI33_10350 [Paenibacillus sp.]
MSGSKLETGIAVKDQPEGVIAFNINGDKLPRSINMNVSINRIGGVKGSWNGQIPIDQSKADKSTQTAR